ncbi:hypothetical protein [uncultured Amnibacterium sp.]|uniref:PIN-like domain-containing protein n=1 Tax=uncultured Amnibacterium sp. TaxID=1631851 RepID=UPI0035CBCB72
MARHDHERALRRRRGEKVPDERWIREATGLGEVLLCKDAHVAQRPLEAEAIYYSSARVFVITAADITGAAMVDWLTRHRASIDRWIGRVDGPFVCGIYEGELRRLKLHAP